MSDKNIQLTSKNNVDYLFPKTKIQNVDGLENELSEIKEDINNIPTIDGGTF